MAAAAAVATAGAINHRQIVCKYSTRSIYSTFNNTIIRHFVRWLNCIWCTSQVTSASCRVCASVIGSTYRHSIWLILKMKLTAAAAANAYFPIVNLMKSSMVNLYGTRYIWTSTHNVASMLRPVTAEFVVFAPTSKIPASLVDVVAKQNYSNFKVNEFVRMHNTIKPSASTHIYAIHTNVIKYIVYKQSRSCVCTRFSRTPLLRYVFVCVFLSLSLFNEFFFFFLSFVCSVGSLCYAVSLSLHFPSPHIIYHLHYHAKSAASSPSSS